MGNTFQRFIMDAKQARAIKFENSLIKKGHTCVRCLETYPVRIEWCMQKVCVNKNINDNKEFDDIGFMDINNNKLDNNDIGFMDINNNKLDNNDIKFMDINNNKLDNNDIKFIDTNNNYNKSNIENLNINDNYNKNNIENLNTNNNYNKNNIENLNTNDNYDDKELSDINDINKLHEEVMEFARSLKAKGHKCISYLESYPEKIDWCMQEVCTHK